MGSPIKRVNAAPWIRRGGSAVLMSAAVHAAAAVTIGSVLALAPVSSGPAPEPAAIDVTVMAAPDVLVPQSAPPPPALAQPAHAAATMRHRPAARPMAATAPAPHPVTSAAPIAAPPADEPPMIFALSAGTVASGPALAAPAAPVPARATPSATGGEGAASVDSATVGEHQVDVPARQLAEGPLAYPPAARQAEIELDFPLEIVVDAAGRVVSARALAHAGYGLEEAALQGIRGYRFSPAMRAGHATAVRMRWVVHFRLR